ncbi:hypothetical protein GGF31_002853 [Allomyces arbusculus]|nr:hypothetical protein GGF31_002853 [Allomyces arbusculus]
MPQADHRNGPPSPTFSTVSTLSSLSSISSLIDLNDLILPSPESKSNSPPRRKRKTVSRSPSPSPLKARRGRTAPSPPPTRSRRGRTVPLPPPVKTLCAGHTAPSPPPAKARRGRRRTALYSPPPPPSRRCGQAKFEVVAAVPLEPQPKPDLDPVLQLDKIRLNTPDDDAHDAVSDDERDTRGNATDCPCPFCGGSFLATWDDLVAELYERVLKLFPTAVRREQTENPTRKDRVEFIINRLYDKRLFQNVAQYADVQERFCLKHRRRAAELEAATEDWPGPHEIDPDALHTRIAALYPTLDSIINSSIPPEAPENHFYRDMCDEWERLGGPGFRSHTNRQRRLQRVRPGYYGQRGQRVLSSALFAAYVHDPENALGVEELGPFRDSEFVLEVLVPTAAVLLIKVDMEERWRREVGWDEALSVTRESAEYGELVFPA